MVSSGRNCQDIRVSADRKLKLAGLVSAPKKLMAAAESPAEVTAGPAGPEPRPPSILPVPCPRCGTFDVTRADLGAAMMKPVVTATLPEDAAFHFHSQR